MSQLSRTYERCIQYQWKEHSAHESDSTYRMFVDVV